MPPLELAIPALLLAAAAITNLVYWGTAFFMAGRAARQPTLREGEQLAAANPPQEKICVIVPAHNESAAIGNVAGTLRTQTHPHMKVLLALDRCTDDTEAKARAAIGDDNRFRIILIDHCPPEWSGKVHALYYTVTNSPEVAEADLLLFVDADTFFEPTCVASAAALLRHRKLGMLSLVSRLTHEKWFEWIVQPAASLELMRQFPLERANREDNRRAFANGQFLLFDKAVYQALGGHEVMKLEMLEDLAYARMMAERKMPAGVVFSDGLLHCRMYGTWKQFRKGWMRIYTEAAKLKVKRLYSYALRARIFGIAIPLAAIALAILALAAPGLGAWRIWLGGLGALSMLAWLAASMRVCILGNTPVIAAPAMIVGHWLLADMLSEAARILEEKRPVNWGGRMYVREVR